MHKRYVPIAVVVAVCIVVAAVGYLLPQDSPDAPTRVVMENSGGRVFFTHQLHAEDLGLACEDCHHDGLVEEGAKPLPCATCHPKEFDDEFRLKHQKSFPSNDYCERCHYTEPSADMPDEDRPDTDMLPLTGDAFHWQCMGCHESMGAGPYGDESCTECHAK